MKIKSLKNYGIPSYILDIWEKHYSPCLLPVQEEAVRNYGVLNDRGNNNLLVISSPFLGKDLYRRDGCCSSGNSSEEDYLFSPS